MSGKKKKKEDLPLENAEKSGKPDANKPEKPDAESPEKSEGEDSEESEGEDHVNRQYRDSVFRDLFFSDIHAKENMMSLYNALHEDSPITDPDEIVPMKIADIFYRKIINDVSFVVRNRTFVFSEHQSTVNGNMPLRCDMYSGRGYEMIVDKKNRYKKNVVMIPWPEFYVFYNGKDDRPMEEYLSIANAYLDPEEGRKFLDLRAKVININTDKHHPILDKCQVLKEYSLFNETVRELRKNKDIEEPMKEAIRVCMHKGILKEYLKRKGSEVENMLIAEYSYEDELDVVREEAREEGEKKGEMKGEKKGEEKGVLKTKVSTSRRQFDRGLSAEDAAEVLGYPLELLKSAYSYFLRYPKWDSDEITKDMMAKEAVRA